MTEFIVVGVESDYDYVEGVNYVKTFSTREEAESFIKDERDYRNEMWHKRAAYIKEWVDNIDGIEGNESKWRGRLNMYQAHNPPILKTLICRYLESRSPAYQPDWPELEGYDPPEIVMSRDLHIMEIK